MRRFRQFVTIQHPVGETRGDEGTVHQTYDNAPGLVDIACTVMRVHDESKEAQMTPISDYYRMVLAGPHPEIEPAWVVLDGAAVFDVLSIEVTIGRRATIVIAEKVAP